MEPSAAPRVVEGTLPITLETRYRLALPDALPSNGRYPWVLALHGFGEGGARFLERLLPLAKQGIAVLAPDGPYPVELREESPPRVGHAWYQYVGDQAEFAAALAFVSEHLERMIARAETEHPLDPARLAVLGYSQGGYLGGAFALARAQRIRALVAVATRIKVELFDPHGLRGLPIRVLAVHGNRDRSVSIHRQRESIDRLVACGIEARLHEHDGGHGLRAELLPPIASFLCDSLAVR